MSKQSPVVQVIRCFDEPDVLVAILSDGFGDGVIRIDHRLITQEGADALADALTELRVELLVHRDQVVETLVRDRMAAESRRVEEDA